MAKQRFGHLNYVGLCHKEYIHLRLWMGPCLMQSLTSQRGSWHVEHCAVWQDTLAALPGREDGNLQAKVRKSNEPQIGSQSGVQAGGSADNINNLQVLPANARYLLGVSYPSSERQHILTL